MPTLLPIDRKVEECFQESRAFLKGGAKASNKTYDFDQETERAIKAYGRIAASKILYGLREVQSSFVMTGQIMRETGNTFANCHEATCLAAEKMPNTLTAVAVSKPTGDHCFLMVGQYPHPGITTDQLTNMPKTTGSYVVDVWAGVCCQTSEYPAQLRDKMMKWQTDHKNILTENGQLTPTQWGETTYSASLTLLSAQTLARGGNKQQTIITMEKKRGEALMMAPGEEQHLRNLRQSLEAEQQLLNSDPHQFCRRSGCR